MKIVNLEQFRAYPENTLYSKYEPCVFDAFEIKVETWEVDFITQNICDAVKADSSGELGAILDCAEKDGDSFVMDFDSAMRDGCFDKDQLFAVWENDDVIALIERLRRCVHA